jgi:hypothetical protein
MRLRRHAPEKSTDPNIPIRNYEKVLKLLVLSPFCATFAANLA